MNEIFEEIKRERGDQNKKFGEQNHTPIEWMAILMEEVGEAAREATDHHFKYPHKDSLGCPHPATNALQDTRMLCYRQELIQIAAVAVQAIECLDRNSKDK